MWFFSYLASGLNEDGKTSFILNGLTCVEFPSCSLNLTHIFSLSVCLSVTPSIIHHDIYISYLFLPQFYFDHSVNISIFLFPFRRFCYNDLSLSNGSWFHNMKCCFCVALFAKWSNTMWILFWQVPGRLQQVQPDLPARHGSVTTPTDPEPMGPLHSNKDRGPLRRQGIEDLLRPFIISTTIHISTVTLSWWRGEATAGDCHRRRVNLRPYNCGPPALISQN